MLLKLEAYHNESDLKHIPESALNQEIAEGLAEHIISRMNVTKNTDGLGRVRITGKVIVLSENNCTEIVQLLSDTDSYTRNKVIAILRN